MDITGEQIETYIKEELSMYDFIIGASNMYEMGRYNNKLVNDLRKGLDWFRKNNPNAYMILLD